MREIDIERELREGVEKTGGRAYKFVSPGNNGVPDRIVIFPGRQPVFVELKTQKGNLSAMQKVQLSRLKRLGQRVEVLKGIDDVSGFFQKEGFEEISKAIGRKYEL